mmetsp:Transcript_14168/g.18870  ORF Transcript_14168/g.18870 Transcript_14168/m.18870 type:complete len:208 (-) Transcript_14168:1145-1768(-)
MTSVVELFPKSQKLSYDSRQQLSQVQNGVMHASELFLSLDELNNQLSIMESLIHKETPAKREMWRRKILELREDASSIRRQGEYYNRMVTAGARQKQEREELMRRRRVRKGGGDDYENAMNDLADESQSIEQSHQMVGEIIASGQASLIGLVEQRLQSAKRALLDIGNKLGLSNSTMRIIERRDITDAYLVFGGMIVTLLVIYFVWF